MTFSEFEYWLDGLKEGMHGKPPTKTQWDKIQKKLETVIPEERYHYWPYYHTTPAYPPYVTWWNGTWSDTYSSTQIPCSTTNLHVGGAAGGSAGGGAGGLEFNNATSTTTFPYYLTN